MSDASLEALVVEVRNIHLRKTTQSMQILTPIYKLYLSTILLGMMATITIGRFKSGGICRLGGNSFGWICVQLL
jgi:hypothetical protein